ncbi:MAG: DUF3823 domain-containing protein [Paludibacteraceae bacterium]|nr:DUF3823 domain-containing protein [Paludibacteraceae bacterium]
MKTRYFIFSSIVFILLAFVACEYDNYSEPDCQLSGRVVYDGKPYVFDGNTNVLKVYQKGFGKKDNGINIRINEDGTFSQMLFPGKYYMTLANQQYPFQFADFASLGAGLGYDTLEIDVDGAKEMELEVIPYYVIDSVTYPPLDETATTLNVTVYFSRNKDPRLPEVLPKVQRAFVFAGINQHINSATTLTKASRPLSVTESDNVTMRLELNKYRSSTYYVNNYRDYLYFRVGLVLDAEFVASGYYLFSDLYRVDNVPYVE